MSVGALAYTAAMTNAQLWAIIGSTLGLVVSMSGLLTYLLHLQGRRIDDLGKDLGKQIDKLDTKVDRLDDKMSTKIDANTAMIHDVRERLVALEVRRELETA